MGTLGLYCLLGMMAMLAGTAQGIYLRYNGSINLNTTEWDPAMVNTNTGVGQTLKTRFETNVKRGYMDTPLHYLFNKVSLTSIGDGPYNESVTVTFMLLLFTNPMNHVTAASAVQYFNWNVSSTNSYNMTFDYPSLEIKDINECMYPDMNDCDKNAMCNNNEGSYNCTCKPNYMPVYVDHPGYMCEMVGSQFWTKLRQNSAFMAVFVATIGLLITAIVVSLVVLLKEVFTTLHRNARHRGFEDDIDSITSEYERRRGPRRKPYAPYRVPPVPSRPLPPKPPGRSRYVMY